MYPLLIILFSMINYKIREDNLHYKQARENNIINCSLPPPELFPYIFTPSYIYFIENPESYIITRKIYPLPKP